MARRPRIEVEGGLYHIITRGVDRRDIFHSPEDHRKFLALLSTQKEKLPFYLYAYCLMTNHIHLLLERRVDDIGKIMHRVLTGYGQYYNRRYHRVGHVLQGRHKAILCQSEQYLTKLVRYIHMNPVRAQMVAGSFLHFKKVAVTIVHLRKHQWRISIDELVTLAGSIGRCVVLLRTLGAFAGLTGSSNSGVNSPASNSPGPGAAKAEKPKLSAAQQSILDSATETAWADQGLAWKLPAGWKKMDVKKESFNYQSPDNAFLLVNISVMPDNFPMDVSLNAYHEQALQQLKNGKYEAVKLVEIDGIPGVEFVEAMPEDKSGPRRHQWIGYRNYLGQKQQLNVMTSTKGTNFEKHTDDFQAILYSMKATK